jgi:hypothetical protein
MGAGDDTFEWDDQDGSDTVEGQDGNDRLLFVGSNDAETFGILPNGKRVLFHRAVADANVFMDLGDVEDIDLSARGGADAIVVNDLSGTDLTALNIDLDSAAGNGTGDGAIDSVIINGGNAGEVIPVGSINGAITVDGAFAGGGGLPYSATISGVEANDSLRINGNGGNDFLQADLNVPVNLSLDSGAGQDTISVVSPAPDSALRVLPSSGDDTVNVNLDGAGIANVLFSATQRIGALRIGSGGIATLASGGAQVLTLTSLNLTGSGTLDLNDNDLILDYSAASPSLAVNNLIRSARNGGAWNGAGLTSTFARNATPRNTTLGLMEATDFKGINGPAATFDGQPIDNTAVLVEYTYYGDANFSGTVNFDDYVHVDVGFNTHRTGWSNGDFNYSGAVDFDDYVLLDVAFNTQGSPLSRLPRRPGIGKR